MQIENAVEKTRKPTTGGVLIGSSYDEARTRKVNAEAEIAELELAKIRGDLCPTEDVVKAWADVLHACRAKFLALPTKVAPVVATETDIAIIKDIVEQQVYEALAELANYEPSLNPTSTGRLVQETDNSGSATETTTSTVSRRVGRPRKAAGLAKQ